MIEALTAWFKGLAEPREFPHPTEATAKVLAAPPGWTFTRVADDVALSRQHVFTELTTLTTWLTALRGPADDLESVVPVEVLLDPDEDTLTAILDHTNRYSDRFTTKLPTASEFDAVNAALDTALEHRAFYLLLQRLKGSLDNPEVLLSAAATLAAHVEAGVEATLDARGVYLVRSATNKADVCSNLPSIVTVTVPIFYGITDPAAPADAPDQMRRYTLELHLTIGGPPTRPTFTLTCPRIGEVVDDARIDVLAQLEAALTAAKVPHLLGMGRAVITQTTRGA